MEFEDNSNGFHLMNHARNCLRYEIAELKLKDKLAVAAKLSFKSQVTQIVTLPITLPRLEP
jgi:hypothetical protein